MSRDSLVNPFVLGLFLEMMIYLLIFLWNGYYKASSLSRLKALLLLTSLVTPILV